MQIPKLAAIRAKDEDLYRALVALGGAIDNHSQQANVDPASNEIQTPSPVTQMVVTEKGGIHDIQITDNNPAYRGVHYFAEYSQDQNNWHQIHLGASQNHRANLGAGPYYWRAFNSYPASGPTNPVYHGGATPAAVGTGLYPGPPMSARQGGTGFGPVYRNSTTPPTRK